MKNINVMTSAMNTISQPHPKVKSIRWSDWLNWLNKTLSVDRRHYQTQNRSMSIQRLWHVAFPNLNSPIFIIGSPRSGTTFLGSCIAELPETSYHFEPVATKAAARYVYEQAWDVERAQRFYRLVYAWLTRIYADGDLRFVDKTPRNCFLIDFLQNAFPDAQFIHIIRDGRDAALSHSKKPWMQAAQAQSKKHEPGGYRYGPYARFWVESRRVTEFESTSDIHRCIWAWRRHTESALATTCKLAKTRYHELRYENLVTNPREESERLLDFLDITALSSRQHFYHAISRARTDSVGLWKKELSHGQLQQVSQEAGKLLKTLGYTA